MTLINWIIRVINKWKSIKKTYGDSQQCDNGGCEACVCAPSTFSKGNA